MEILIAAARSGKEVTVVVELLARFDEEANINWAQRLEDAGAHVVYGVVGHKMHAKMLMVVRREDGALRRYVHLSTGNYHTRTTKLYTDLGLITANEEICADVNDVFVQLTGLGKATKLKHLWESPFTLHKKVLQARAADGSASANMPSAQRRRRSATRACRAFRTCSVRSKTPRPCNAAAKHSGNSAAGLSGPAFCWLIAMDLILWRHAEAEEGPDDGARTLTARGVKQAKRVGAWLDKRLPKDARVIVSPAVRAQQTAGALPRTSETVHALKPGAQAAAVLKAAGWPDGNGTVVLVGHQPTLGAAAAIALTGRVSQWRMKKGGVWWISARTGEASPAVVAVMTPDLV